jgi:mRNA interferase MazF
MKIRVKLDERTKVQGDILCEQIRIIDLKERMYRTVENIPTDILQNVSNIINTLISID